MRLGGVEETCRESSLITCLCPGSLCLLPGVLVFGGFFSFFFFLLHSLLSFNQILLFTLLFACVHCLWTHNTNLVEKENFSNCRPLRDSLGTCQGLLKASVKTDCLFFFSDSKFHPSPLAVRTLRLSAQHIESDHHGRWSSRLGGQAY